MLLVSSATMLLFGAMMGFLWLGVGSLVAGAAAGMVQVVFALARPSLVPAR